MKGIAMLAAALLAATSVAGLDPMGIPHPRTRRKRVPPTPEEMREAHLRLEQESKTAREAHDKAEDKRRRRAEKRRKIAESNGLEGVV